jgi:hypothetical protein
MSGERSASAVGAVLLTGAIPPWEGRLREFVDFFETALAWHPVGGGRRHTLRPGCYEEAQAGGFGVREQSAYFLGSAFAGFAAGGEISSVFWNSAATAALPGCNASSSYSGKIASGDEVGQVGLFVSGVLPVALGLHPCVNRHR